MQPVSVTTGDLFAARRDCADAPEEHPIYMYWRAAHREGHTSLDYDAWVDELPLADMKPVIELVTEIFAGENEGESPTET